MNYLSVKNRAILREMVATDFKVRYQSSVLGYAWSLLKPLLLFAVLYVLFTYIAPIGQGIEHYGVTLLLGIVLWSFFAETTMIGASSIVSHGDILRKVSIPRYLVVIASSFSALINMALSMIVVFVFAFLNGLTPELSWLLLPLIIVELFILGLGVAFILATAYVRFRDVTYIWEVVLQAGFYSSAIIFPMTIVPEKWRDHFFLNPIVQIVQDARAALIPSGNQVTIWNSIANDAIRLVPFIIILVIAVVGYKYFKSQSKYFAEDI